MTYEPIKLSNIFEAGTIEAGTSLICITSGSAA
jgi:hypothetical protein